MWLWANDGKTWVTDVELVDEHVMADFERRLLLFFCCSAPER